MESVVTRQVRHKRVHDGKLPPPLRFRLCSRCRFITSSFQLEPRDSDRQENFSLFSGLLERYVEAGITPVVESVHE
jgi:hypothetical protein